MGLLANLVLLLGLSAASATPADPSAWIGTTVADFTLPDFQGARRSLDDFARSKIVVIAFLGTECPMAARYGPRLAELARAYGPRGVAFLGIDANDQDSLADLARYARRHEIAFPLLKDAGNVIANRLGAERTPEVFVLDARRRIRYRGRIDDQYGIDAARPRAGRRDLAAALDDLLAGTAVRCPVTEVQGCYIGRVHRPADPAARVTYARQVSRILQKRCVSCHRAGEVAPFALTSYRSAAGWSETIREVIHEGRMPPWYANPEYGSFANEARLTAEEIRFIDEWVAAGAPEGDPRDLPEPAHFVPGWSISGPDLVLEMPEPYRVKAHGTLDYEYFTVDPGFTEDYWVQAAEARPGNRSVVHHILVFIQRPGDLSVQDKGGLDSEWLATYVPGGGPLQFGDGLAKLVPAGSKVIFQVHYTPNGTVQTDRSRVGLVFADPGTVRREVRTAMAANFRFRIPPGAPDHRLTARYEFPQDMTLYALVPHMHLRGKSFRFEADYPDGRHEVLLDVPNYSFNWQLTYYLEQPKRMPEHTVLRCEGHFDNSAENPSNPNPKKAVAFGNQTSDEMLIGYFFVALAEQDLALGAPEVRPRGDGTSEVVFRYRPPPGTGSVYLAGGFNDWKPTAHRMDGPDEDGRFSTRLYLKPGRYEYKFVIEGRSWRADPGNREQSGFFNNSVVTVPLRP